MYGFGQVTSIYQHIPDSFNKKHLFAPQTGQYSVKI